MHAHTITLRAFVLVFWCAGLVFDSIRGKVAHDSHKPELLERDREREREREIEREREREREGVGGGGDPAPRNTTQCPDVRAIYPSVSVIWPSPFFAQI